MTATNEIQHEILSSRRYTLKPVHGFRAMKRVH
jgi:hypothetical protein